MDKEPITIEGLDKLKSELDQLIKIFNVLGAPTSEIWLNLHSIPSTQNSGN